VEKKMVPGETTGGKVARMVAGAEGIEIKATVPRAQIQAAMARYGLVIDPGESRYIYFFDTPDLDLMKAGIIARARRVVGGEHDSTIKFRPVEPVRISTQWRKYPGFKIEADASEKGVVTSGSFSMPVKKGRIKRIAAGELPIAELFTEEQRAFLREMAKHEIDFSRVTILGPLSAHRWTFEDPACPWPLTVELWEREDGEMLMELSIKTPVQQAAAAIGGFMAFLAEVGAERDVDQQAKTRWAMSHYATKIRPPLADPPVPDVVTPPRAGS
jgi:hypothetical protein